MLKKKTVVFFMGWLLFLSGLPLHGRDKTGTIDSLTEAQVDTALREVQTALEQNEWSAKLWFRGFLSAYSLLAIGSVTGAGSTKIPDKEPNLLFNAWLYNTNSTLFAYNISRSINYIEITDRERFIGYQLAGNAGLIYAANMDHGYREALQVRHQKQDMIANAWSSVAGATLLALNAYQPAIAPEKFRSMSENSLEDRRRKLAYGEESLRLGAAQNLEARGFVNQAVAILGNGLVAAAYRKGFHRSTSDTLSFFATNLIISEIQIFTMPRGVERTWHNYSRKDPKAQRSIEKNTLKFAGLALYPRGLCVVFTF